MENFNDIAKNIQHLRKRANLTTQQLAMFIGITEQELKDYEEGVTEISINFLEAVSLFFGIEMIDFFEKDLSKASIPMALAFRTHHLAESDYESIRKFRKIIANYTKMKKINAND